MINLFKKISIFTAGILLISTLSYSQDDSKQMESEQMKGNHKSMEPVGVRMDDGMLYGKDYDHSMNVMTFSDLINSTADNNGKVIIVKGDISEVCQKMGCWMIMSDGTNSVRVKTLHEFFLPKDVAGRQAVVTGTFNITEITEDEAKHYQEESNKPGQKSEEIKGTQKAFEIDAMGIKILDPGSDPSK